jgi:hypothetical protein
MSRNGGWQFIYDKDHANVYDPDYDAALNLSWDGNRLKIDTSLTTTGTALELDIDGVVKLRKLLQAIERRDKEAGKGA